MVERKTRNKTSHIPCTGLRTICAEHFAHRHPLEAAGCLRVFADKKSGKDADRPKLQAVLDYLRPGDTLVVPSLDRLTRSLQDLITIVADLRWRGVGFRSLNETLDTTPADGSSSTSSPPWPSSSASSSSREPTRA